jgi:hypothetical protein
MNGQGGTGRPTVRGWIRDRLLVNAVVDPDEAAARLPSDLRPHVTEQGTVVGCCLLDIGQVRPAWVPSAAGRPVWAVAHRISVEWDSPSGELVVGVYVPVRHTSSRLAISLGGRWFPGVHEPAQIAIERSSGTLRWSMAPVADRTALAIAVEVSDVGGQRAVISNEPVGATCLAANIGLSPDHHGRLEAAAMTPQHRMAQEVAVESLDSAFLDGFTTAAIAPSYRMTEVAVTWSRASAPEPADQRVPA